MHGESNGFFFSFCTWDSITVLTSFFFFFGREKIKLKGLLFQNLYEDILVHQKLKTKQRIPLIYSIED